MTATTPPLRRYPVRFKDGTVVVVNAHDRESAIQYARARMALRTLDPLWPLPGGRR